MAFGTYSGHGRGGFAPRRGGFHPKFTKRNEVKLDLVKHPLGELLTTLNNSDLKPTLATPGDAALIKDCEYVASYNWVDATTPTIMIPGKPPLWTPLQKPRRLEGDNGTYYRDPNAARFPMYPTEPAVHALFTTSPNFPTEDIDVFGCGSTMGNLLRFVRLVDKPFRFNVEVTGDTVFFVRKENDPRETIDGVKGYGHTFPEAYTTWESDVKGSESHQRLVQYDFGGYRCIIRFECDGYLQTSNQEISVPNIGTQSGLDDLLHAFDNTAITRDISNLDSPLTVQTAGCPPPQATIFDLKTRSCRYQREIDMADIYPSLWLKQIPHFIIAYHDGHGTFQDIRVRDISKDVQEWEKANGAAIQRLAVLLKKIVDAARQDGTGLLEVYSPTVDCLEIRRQHGKGAHALPPKLRSRWEGKEDGGALIVGNDCSEDDGKHDEIISAKAYTSFSDDSDDDDPDYTACSADTCGYCGKCRY